MTVIEHLFASLHAALDEIVGRHPELASNYTPMWTKELRDEKPAEPFKGKPRKRRKAA